MIRDKGRRAVEKKNKTLERLSVEYVPVDRLREILADDVARAKRFYEGLFGWKIEEAFAGYDLINTGEGNLFALFQDDESAG